MDQNQSNQWQNGASQPAYADQPEKTIRVHKPAVSAPEQEDYQSPFQPPEQDGFQPVYQQPLQDSFQPIYPQPSNDGYQQQTPGADQPPVPTSKSYTGDVRFKPLGAWAMFGFGVLFSVPVVGWIFAIIYSFDEKNVPRRNLARTFWIWSLFLLVVTVILTSVAAGVIISLLNDSSDIDIREAWDKIEKILDYAANQFN